MPNEISLEKVMEILELPAETLFKLSQAKTPEAQATELAEVKAIVMMQRRALAGKYSRFTIGGGRHLALIKQAADIIHSLELPPVPGGMVII